MNLHSTNIQTIVPEYQEKINPQNVPPNLYILKAYITTCISILFLLSILPKTLLKQIQYKGLIFLDFLHNLLCTCIFNKI